MKFHYADVLSVTDGRLISLRHMDGVYDIINFLAGEDVSTVGLTVVAPIAKRHILSLFPGLADVKISESISMAVTEWRDSGEAAESATLKKFLDKNVLPLMPSEYLELTEISKDLKDVE